MRSCSFLLLVVVGATAAVGAVDGEVGRLRDEVARLRGELQRARAGGAEPAAADACSGAGYYYSDVSACMCFSCFSGERCEVLEQGCSVTDSSGNPVMFEEYWRNSTAAMTTPIFYRSPYQFGNSLGVNPVTQPGTLLPALNRTIFELHDRVNNIAGLSQKKLVIGSGGTELISASVWACKQRFGAGRTMYLYAPAPYYQGYLSTEKLGIAGVVFTTNETLPAQDVIEMITYPNNPTNTFRAPKYPGAPCHIHDQVYWWPSVTNLTVGHAPLATEISMFSMSKLTGHAGTRFGWALVEDAETASLMDQFIETVQIHISIDAQYRTYTVLNHLLYVDNLQFFSWVHDKLAARWSALSALLSPDSQTRFLQHAVPGGFYAWITCEREAEKLDCTSVFQSNGITAIPGSSMGATRQFIRLELVAPDAVWNLVMARVTAMTKA
ncbi:Tryptophan aminotransferase-related protein 3 [Diplonema papillatum]|nr:Tryptophan aminotransferase-related protein 3 [Diplonema papillatum]